MGYHKASGEYDEAAYENFIKKQQKNGLTEKQARDMGAMYRHHFRIWK